MQRSDLAVGLMAFAALTFAAVPAFGQGIGGHVGYDFESEHGLLGLTAHFPITVGSVPKTTISPQVEVLTTTAILVVNAGASIRFHPWWRADAGISPYFGAGLLLGYNDFTEETEVAGQAIAGLEFPMGTISPFAQIEFAFGGFDVTAFIGGLQLNF